MTDPQAIPLPIACAPTTDAPALAAMLRQHAPWTVLTGAGISTDSGIPVYRDENGDWKRPAPVQFKDFMAHASATGRAA